MANIFRDQSRGVGRAVLVTLLLITFASRGTLAQLYKEPVLIIDPGMHRAPINDIGVDAAGRLAVTGSDDKTLRLWSLSDGKSLRTIRMPAGPGNIGKIYAVAMNPDGTLVAAGGYTGTLALGVPICLFETQTGKMIARIDGISEVTDSLAFSSDGRYLAAGLGATQGLRVYDRDQQRSEAFRDTNYGGAIYGVTFADDGRLATTSFDGKVRLYDRRFKLVVPPKEVTDGTRPFKIAFNPDGTVLAVGKEAAMVVDLFDGHSLAPLPGAKAPLQEAKVSRKSNDFLEVVAWSKDGKTLYAGGQFAAGPIRPVVVWSNTALEVPRGAFSLGKRDSVMGLAGLPDGRLLVASADPFLALLERDGRPRWKFPSLQADFREQRDKLAVSADGTIVDFGFEIFGQSPLRFDLRALKLTRDPPADQQTAKQTGPAVDEWFHGFSPAKPIKLEYEKIKSLAIRPDGGVVLGTDFFLRAFDAKGKQLWRRDAPADAHAVNITGDGRLVVAAYGDGTIRWHRLDDGRELLALYVLANKDSWVAWTPEGFYGATTGTYGVLEWQVNRGPDAAADTVPVNAIQNLRRPDVLALVLQELETARALSIADLKAARRDVQIATKSAKAPGARLHVLAIGISDYGGKAGNLRLNFAARDAQDVASALIDTQEGGLYAEVKSMFLHDSEADKDKIFDAFAAMDRNMTNSAGRDLAVVMFSGHGTMIDNQFYLVPYGADSSTMARLKSSAIPATEIKSEIEKLAQHGRILVLLDACRSAGLIGGPSNALPAAEVLKAVMNASNVTVLTSSAADKVSRENEKWGHGAFTKALLDALSASNDVDSNHDGVISMSEFTAYVARRLTELTGGDQQLGLDQRFQGDIFVVGL
jgi:WD40 repeat protein